MSEIPDEVLDRVERALKDCYHAALTLSNGLNEPYLDDPRWTPWTRWLGPASQKAYDARRELRDSRENH